MFIGPSSKTPSRRSPIPADHERPVRRSAGHRPPQDHPRVDGEPVYLVVIDEYAYYSATIGNKNEREDFAALARDLIARGRAAGVILILATQRPSHQIIDPSMRDLFSYRWRSAAPPTPRSDVVLGQGWAGEDYTAAEIDPLARGVAWLLSETGVPRRIKTAWLDDDTIKYLAAYAARLRGTRTPHEPPARPERPPRPITPGPPWRPGHCQDPLTPNRAGRVRSRTMSTPRSPAASCAPTPAASPPATSRPSP